LARGDRPPAADLVAAAAQAACLLDVMTPKPGNARAGRDLPGLAAADLTASAVAIGPVFRRHAGGPVGRLILAAVRATRRQVRTNTNLGMILLLAPLAAAALAAGRGRPLRARLRGVLRRLDARDADDAYRAIRLARPGGLGRVRRQDVASKPTVTLLRAMRLAERRDAVAREYATGFAVTFTVALPTLRRLRARHVPLPRAIAQTYLTLLAARPDTLIARRHGLEAARAVSGSARSVLRAGGMLTPRGRRLAAALDRWLRTHRPPLNPGATADLVAATLFAWLVEAGSLPGNRSQRPRRRGRAVVRKGT
jgi:triphosphoribosyl-dephospho-CoA synthase